MASTRMLLAALVAAVLSPSPPARADCNANGIDDVDETERGDSPDCNANGVPDECETRAGFSLAPPVHFAVGERPHLLAAGDLDGDGDLDLVSSDRASDALFLLNYSFLSGPAPRCLSACDANGDAAVLGAVTDAVHMLTFNFLEGPAPPQPFPDCGVGDRRDKALGCDGPPRDCL